MARDYLAIQGSVVPSEHAFSSGTLTATARHNQLSGDIFEALQICQSGYWNGHIVAVYLEELVMLDYDSDTSEF